MSVGLREREGERVCPVLVIPLILLAKQGHFGLFEGHNWFPGWGKLGSAQGWADDLGSTACLRTPSQR